LEDLVFNGKGGLQELHHRIMSNNFELVGFFVHNGIFDDTIQLMLG
jgi:hypothetical protein